MKKIFALVLSLCIVLSTFVAVSAQEMVYDEGVWREGVWTDGTQSKTEIASGNSDTDGVGYGNHQGSTFSTATEEGRTNVHKLTATGATGASSFYMPLKNSKGVQFQKSTLPKSGTIAWSVDLKVSDATGVTTYMALRASSKPGETPLNAGEVKIKDNLGLESGVWKTISGTIDLGTTTYAADGYATIMARANLPAGAELYVDNFTWNLETKTYGEWIVDFEEDFADGMGEVMVGKNGISGVVENGVLKATSTGATSHDGLIGVQVKDTDGNGVKVRDIDPNAVVKWSIDVMAPDKNKLKGNLNFREGGWTPTGFSMALSTINSTTVSANNKWFTFEGVSTVGALVATGSGSNGNQTYFSFRPEMASAGDVYVDNMRLEIYVPVADEDVVEPGWEVEAGWEREPLGWIAPDYNISYTTKKAMNNVGTLEDGTFTATMREVYVYEKARYDSVIASGQSTNLGDGVGYQPWVWADEVSIPAGKSFNISYNLTTDGILNSIQEEYPELTVRARFYWYNAESTNANKFEEINASYRPNMKIKANTGEAVQVTQLIDGSQLSKDVVSVRLVLDVGSSVSKNDYADSDAYFTISDIVLTEIGSKVALSADKTANGVNLTLTNANAQKYKFAGRLLAAEYEVVDGVKELVQFTELAVDEEIEAGTNKVVTANFEGAIAAGNQVYVFVWEPASFSPITMFVK